MFEILKLLQKSLKFFTAFDHYIQHKKYFLTHFLYIVDVNTDQNFFYFIRHIINMMAESNNILSFNWSDKCFCQLICNLVSLCICLTLDLMNLFHLL